MIELELMRSIYTDGGCSPNPGAGGWACVVVYDKAFDKEPLAFGGSEAATTNNRMEVQAVLEALLLIQRRRSVGFTDPVHIYSDSKYVIDAVTSWIYNWAKSGWTRKGEELKNADLWKRVYSVLKDIGKPAFAIHHVKGHSGNEMNELADLMATYYRDEQGFLCWRDLLPQVEPAADPSSESQQPEFEIWWSKTYQGTLGPTMIEASFKEVAKASWDAALAKLFLPSDMPDPYTL